MVNIWGNTEDAEEAAKNSFEKHLEEILSKQSSIHIDDLLKRMWGGYNLLTNYQSILEGVNHLAKDGKIVFHNKIISPATVTTLESEGLEEKTVWSLIQKEKEVEEKKEVMRRYAQINPLS